jgi:hypothetical protein
MVDIEIEEGKFTSLVFDTGSENAPQGFTVIRFVNGDEYKGVGEVRVGTARQVLGANRNSAIKISCFFHFFVELDMPNSCSKRTYRN